jgi:hypothetical protein
MLTSRPVRPSLPPSLFPSLSLSCQLMLTSRKYQQLCGFFSYLNLSTGDRAGKAEVECAVVVREGEEAAWRLLLQHPPYFVL